MNHSILGSLLRSLILLVVVGSAMPAPAEAQRTRADTAQVILEVSNELRAAGHHADADELLRILVRRFGETLAAREAEQLLIGGRREGRPGSGTAEFVAWHTVLGATLGVLFPAAFEASSPEPYGAGLLLGGPLGYALSRAYVDQHPITSGQALMINYSSIWGMIQAPLWRDVLDIGERTECFGTPPFRNCFETSPDNGPEVAIVGALTGLTAGVALAANRPVSTGTALGTMFASQWGLFYGLIGRTLADQQDGDVGVTWLLAGGNAGLLAGIFGAPGLQWSAGRTWLVNLSGVAGLVGALGVSLLFDISDDKSAATVFGLGGALGLAAGVATTRQMDAGSARADVGLMSNALVGRMDGEWQFGMPLPQPALLPSAGLHPDSFERGWKLNLFRASW